MTECYVKNSAMTVSYTHLIHSKLTGGIENIKVCYVPDVDVNDFEEEVKNSRQKDIKYKATSKGPFVRIGICGGDDRWDGDGKPFEGFPRCVLEEFERC